MTAAERVLRFAAELYDRKAVTAAEMDRLSGRARRTRKRDVDLLRRVGWRIEWDAPCQIYRINRPAARRYASPLSEG